MTHLTMQQKRVNLDSSQDSYFKKVGYNVVRIWGSELRENPDILIERIKNASIITNLN